MSLVYKTFTHSQCT